ncbi:MAG: carboxypeptidase-like regulatory domain-containing protein [Chitinophagales bacterium]
MVRKLGIPSASFEYTTEIVQNDTNTNIIRGTVFEFESKKGIPFATIFDASKKVVYTCNSVGHFEIKIPRRYFDNKVALNISAVGYEQSKVNLKRKYLTKDLNIYLHIINNPLY